MKDSVSTVTLVTHGRFDPSALRTASALVLDDVGVTIDGRTVLTGVTFEVGAGEHWAVLGPNGGGKSTLIRLASLQLHPSVGTLRIFGEKLGRVDVRPLRARIGVSSASLVDQLRGSLTAEEIVRCGRFGALEPWWHSYDDGDTSRAEDLLARLGLGGFGARRFSTLSSGERQRVLLARTLMPAPELILLDEPTAGLDFGGREELVTALQDLAADPSSPPSILVTHRVEDLPATTTHVAAVRGGRMVAAGPIDETLTADLLGDVFGLAVSLSRNGSRWAAHAC